MRKPKSKPEISEPKPYEIRLSRDPFTVEPTKLLLGDDLQNHPFIVAARMSNLTRRRLALDAEGAWSIDGGNRFRPSGIVAVMAWFRLDRAGNGLFLPEREGGRVLPYQIDTILILHDGTYVLGLPRTTAAVMGYLLQTVEVIVPPTEEEAHALGRLAP